MNNSRQTNQIAVLNTRGIGGFMGEPERVFVSEILSHNNRSTVGFENVVSIESAMVRLDCVCELTRRAARRVTQLYDLVLAPAHLKSSQFILLQTISEAGEIAQWQISRILCVAVETLTRRLATMRRESWVQLRMGKDRRERLYSITELGRTRLNQARPYWERAQQRLREQLGAEMWVAMQASLNHLARAAALSASARRKNTIS